MRVQAHLSFYCCKTKPRPCLLASVHRCVGRLGSKNERVGAVVSDSLAIRNAQSWSEDQRKSLFVLRRGWSSANRVAMESVLAESWFANPKKERRSVRLTGVGNLDIASVTDRSIW